MVVIKTQLRFFFTYEAGARRLEEHGELDTGLLLCNLSDLGKRRYACHPDVNAVAARRIEGRFPLRWHLVGEEIGHL